MAKKTGKSAAIRAFLAAYQTRNPRPFFHPFMEDDRLEWRPPSSFLLDVPDVLGLEARRRPRQVGAFPHHYELGTGLYELKAGYEEPKPLECDHDDLLARELEVSFRTSVDVSSLCTCTCACDDLVPPFNIEDLKVTFGSLPPPPEPVLDAETCFVCKAALAPGLSVMITTGSMPYSSPVCYVCRACADKMLQQHGAKTLPK